MTEHHTTMLYIQGMIAHVDIEVLWWHTCDKKRQANAGLMLDQ